MKKTANINVETLKKNIPFISKKKALFKMIKRDEVPQDYYLSEIVGISWGTIKDGKRVLEVYYKIEETYQAMLRTADALEDWYTPTYKYVKEIYIEGRYKYRCFMQAMAAILDKDNFQFHEVLGVQEYIGIGYVDNNLIGFIHARGEYYDGLFDDMHYPGDIFEDRNGGFVFK